MLAASDGYLRFGSADIYLSQHWWLNTDVFVHQTYDRANTGFSSIHIFLNELDEPLYGGGVFHHEWGHWEYDLDDEYIDINPDGTSIPICHNSVMGNSGVHSGVPAFEFCTNLNHKWASGTAEDAVWPALMSHYGIGWGASYLYPSEEGQYLDVLHALEGYIGFAYYQ
jgi:hypothetical protein